MRSTQSKYGVGAVVYLNTVPLIWGMLHGAESEQTELSLSIPSACAQQMEDGSIDIGLIPVAEIARQGLEIVPGVGITCLGPVRSILLISRVPWRRLRTLAVDLSSRTSVELARIILREHYGVEPLVRAREPVLETMLRDSEAALLIGDPALRIEPGDLPFESLDLGSEWHKLTGLPMVFAAWAGKPGLPVESFRRLTLGSWGFGKNHLEEIVRYESAVRNMDRELVNHYLREHIRYEVGPSEQRGLEAFLELAGLERSGIREEARVSA